MEYEKKGGRRDDILHLFLFSVASAAAVEQEQEE